MVLFPTRAEHLAAHLRARILKNEWREPFPNVRDWARQLAVGRDSLCTALKILQKENLLEIENGQGVHLKRKSKRRISAPLRRLVRIVYYGVDYPCGTSFIHWAGPLSAVLQKRGGQLSIEKQSDERLRELCHRSLERPAHTEDLLLPFGVPAKYQNMLAASGRPCIYIGTPADGIKLSFVVGDLPGTVRHATHTLIRRGFHKLTLILGKVHSPGIRAVQENFMAACGEWTGKPIEAKTLLVHLNDREERSALNRFADQISLPHGILLMPPVPTGLVVTTLTAKNIRLPTEVNVIVMTSHPDAICLHPPLTHYPFPTELFVKAVANAIFNYWETGKPPVIQKIIPMKMVSPRKN